MMEHKDFFLLTLNRELCVLRRSKKFTYKLWLIIHLSLPQMHRCALQLEETESDVPSEHVAKSHYSCSLFTMRSVFGDWRVRHQSDDQGLGVGSVGGQREQLRRYRYRWIQRTQICSQLRCKSLTTHKTSLYVGQQKLMPLHVLPYAGLFSDGQVYRISGLAARQHCQRFRLEIKPEDCIEQSQCQSRCSFVQRGWKLLCDGRKSPCQVLVPWRWTKV